VRPNFLLITVDDMNYNSGDFLKDKSRNLELMPHVSRLMEEGMTFENSHVTIALCQPSRSVLMTGKYPHCNGAMGFEDIHKGVQTLTGILKKHGYYNGIIGKENHISPREQFAWDIYEHTYDDEHDYGRNPECYYELTKTFLKQVKEKQHPFFLMVNSHDPHRPFAGSEDEISMFGRNIPYDKEFRADDVEVPAFLPDLPEIRMEFAQYLTSVYRADQMVGRVMTAVAEAGAEVFENTMVMFLSDNGMSMPFAKANCYLNSTKSPYVVSWKGHIKEGTVTNALVTSLDYMPTVLELAGIDCPVDVNGKSFAHIFEDNDAEQYEDIYTSFYKTAKNYVTKRELQFPMRCVQNRQYAYIFNGWHGQEQQYRTETMAGLTFKAMQEAAKTDEAIAGRVRMYCYRTPEELYDYIKDPDALHNLAEDPQYSHMVKEMRSKMCHYMKLSKDDLLDHFKETII